MEKYRDMLDLPHPEPTVRPRMARSDRAAQFAPFAALTGYDEQIDEAARASEDAVRKKETGEVFHESP